MPPSRQGLLYGVAAYVIWGAFPLYWPLLEPAGSVELLAHRVVWSVITLAVLLVLLRRRRQFRELFTDRRVLGMLTLAAFVITLNWGTYIYGVTNDRVVETSLGYFINPLVTVLMGVLLLGERLRPLQWSAIGIGALACLVLTVDYGHPPWIALVLAFSFGTYGLAKKQAGAEAVESLTFETLLIAPFALAYLGWLSSRGDSSFASEGWGHALLLMSAGLVTAVPLLCFGAAAIRVPLVTLGLMQYLAPVLQFVLGVFYFHEDMSSGRWIGFALVWVALSIFTFESLRNRRHLLRLAAEAAAV
ncbi:EamA family transporter RarD [Nocardioides agariphilus]|uniref:EamA family transporter RarD n=1 Tax=Nocardioides agariphilus TaxID=433664 RepID=UPI00352254A7